MFLPAVTAETFDQTTQSKPVMIIHCWAKWNRHDIPMLGSATPRL